MQLGKLQLKPCTHKANKVNRQDRRRVQAAQAGSAAAEVGSEESTDPTSARICPTGGAACSRGGAQSGAAAGVVPETQVSQEFMTAEQGNLSELQTEPPPGLPCQLPDGGFADSAGPTGSYQPRCVIF